MSEPYDHLAVVAASLLAKYGQSVTLKSSPVGVYNPATGTVAAVPTTATRKAAVFTFGAGLTTFRGTLIQQNDRKCLMEPGIAPSDRDTVTVGANEYQIMSVAEISPAGTPVVYSLHLRR